MIQRIRLFLELVRFSHTVFALPFALTSAALAWVVPLAGAEVGFRWLQLLGIVLCMVFARSAAMAFNRLADRHYDAANPRTAGRHLPSGRLSVPAVWAFTLVSSAGFVGSTLLFFSFGNPWPLYFAVPVLLFLCAYSWTKRFTALAHFWLGTSLCLAPVAAWIAIRGLAFDNLGDLKIPALLGLAVLFWVSGFDILYACQDVDFDRAARLHSIPVQELGVPRALRLALVCHLFMVAALVGLFLVGSPPLGVVYLLGLLAVTILLAYEHWLVRPDDLTRVNNAFFHVNALISIGLFALVLVEVVLR